MNPFEDLPSELVNIILSYFTIDSDIISFSHTCRANRSLVFQFKAFQFSFHSPFLPQRNSPTQSIVNLFEIQCKRWYTPISKSRWRPRPLKIKEVGITATARDFLKITMEHFDKGEIVRLHLASIGPGQPLTTVFSQLALCPNLQHLHLDLQRAPEYNSTILHELETHLVNLKTLELVHWKPNFFLRLPHLVKLKVLGGGMIRTSLGFFFTSNFLTDVELSCRNDILSPVVLPLTLRRLVLKDLAVPYDLSALQQLVELRLGDGTQNIQATLSSLSTVSHLRILGIHDFGPNPYAHLCHQLLAAQKLNRLDLFVDNGEWLASSLDLLSTLESLRDLRLRVQHWLSCPQPVFKSLGKFPASVRMALDFSQDENNHMELFERPECVWSLRNRETCVVLDWTRFVHLRHLELVCKLEPEMIFSLPRATRTLSIKSGESVFVEAKPAWELVKNLFVHNPQLDTVVIHWVVRNQLDFLLECSSHADLVEVQHVNRVSASFLRTTSARQCTKRLPPSEKNPDQPWYNKFGESC